MSAEDGQSDADCGQSDYTEENITYRKFSHHISHFFFGLAVN